MRKLERVIPSIPASDGAGVKLRRSLGSSQFARHDPFLMLDEFFSDDPRDYLAGFPAHPHRGFETVTYMLDGHMRHQDNHGNTGDLGPGDVQWMSAARGIVHSEMPQQTEGRMRGFQLWLNLPAREKMRPAAYRDIPSGAIPTVHRDGARVRVIAGELDGTRGPIHGGSTDPYYFDVHLSTGAVLEAPLPSGHNAFLYVYEGEALVGEAREPVARRAAGLLSAGGAVRLEAGAAGARLLVLAGKPLREPVVQYGPFVMNTREEIEQAIADYQAGTFAREGIERMATG
ncbi:MAG TPA: pirin family protein [Burkholderiales bacterium]|nr:pirin family protein [Burkholderiales bacterium]